MKNTLIALALIGGIGTGIVAPAHAHHHNEEIVADAGHFHGNKYIDQSDIESWSDFQIDVLTQLGILSGYPDGTFRPNRKITRAEVAVALFEALVFIEEQLYLALDSNNEALFNELALQQTEIARLAAKLDEVATQRTLTKKNNWVAIGIVNVPDDDGAADTAIELVGKVQVFKLSNKLAISVRPFVNTVTELGAAATLDLDLTDSLELWAGIGATKRLDESTVGTLTGTDTDVVPYVEGGVSLDFSKNVGAYTVVRSPLNSNEFKELTVGTGIKVNF